jgi:hypothetical protein
VLAAKSNYKKANMSLLFTFVLSGEAVTGIKNQQLEQQFLLHTL